MLCGVTATQGSNPCATAFRLVAPTDVGATSFFVRQVSSTLGGAGLLWDLRVSAKMSRFFWVGPTSVRFGYFQLVCQASPVEARDKAWGSVWSPAKNFFVFLLQTGHK